MKDAKSGKPPLRVLVVCHGNVCRSPLAEAVLKQELPHAEIRSRACKKHYRAPCAAKKVREYASGLGFDLSTHRGISVTTADVTWADIVLYMDNNNRNRIDEYTVTGTEHKLCCLGKWIGVPAIPDPGYTPRGAELTRRLDMVVEACKSFAKEQLTSQ